jgi:eukaryotic-like serine/threonine-protein kinase
MTDTIVRLTSALSDRYAIKEELGQGGMATVYLAEDLKHDRKVAIKVLRPELAAVLGAERFVQEIKTTAALQHPNILPLFDSGLAGGTGGGVEFLYYVMPFIDGETLRDKLNRETQLGIEEAVRITTEIADALNYAHGENVIHRDIKPENILLHNGRPMVADFGIALAVSAAAGGRMTETGLSLGTPHYMSPEQATAEKDITSRSDIYSLGSVLYEMLTGEPPHTGSSAQQIIMKIVTDHPRPVEELRKSVPANVAAATAVALAKLPADRFASAEAFRAALANPSFRLDPTESFVALAYKRHDRTFLRALGVLAVVLALVAAWGWFRPTPISAPALRLRLAFPPDQAVVTDAPSIFGVGAQLALSPDGSVLVYSGPRDQGGTQLWARPLNEIDARPLPGTENAVDPTFSPAGDLVAFMTVDNRLKVVPVDGGPAVTIADSGFVWGTGLSWGDDGMLYTSDGVGTYHTVAISYDDRTIRRITRPESARRDQGFVFPYALPGGEALLVRRFPEMGSYADMQLAAVSIETGDVTDLGIPAVGTFYVDPGYLGVVQDGGTLVMIPFDASRLTFTGPPVAAEEGIMISVWGQASVSVSRSGTLAYHTGTVIHQRPALVSRNGQIRDIDAPWSAGLLWTLSLSPDGQRLAVSITNDAGHTNIWINELGTRNVSQFTAGTARSFRASWYPDDESILFLSNRRGLPEVYRKPADAGGAAVLVLSADQRIEEVAWSRDTTWMLYRTESEDGRRRILGIRPGVDTAATPLSPAASDSYTPALSPDDRLLAYVSLAEGGRIPETYVQPFPGSADARVRISTDGGTEPRWSHSGRELFYRNTLNQLVAVEVGPGPGISFGVREVILGGASFLPDAGGRGYDVLPGDSVFAVIRTSVSDEGSLVLVTNWWEELKKRLRN